MPCLFYAVLQWNEESFQNGLLIPKRRTPRCKTTRVLHAAEMPVLPRVIPLRYEAYNGAVSNTNATAFYLLGNWIRAVFPLFPKTDPLATRHQERQYNSPYMCEVSSRSVYPFALGRNVYTTINGQTRTSLQYTSAHLKRVIATPAVYPRPVVAPYR